MFNAHKNAEAELINHLHGQEGVVCLNSIRPALGQEVNNVDSVSIVYLQRLMNIEEGTSVANLSPISLLTLPSHPLSSTQAFAYHKNAERLETVEVSGFEQLLKEEVNKLTPAEKKLCDNTRKTLRRLEDHNEVREAYSRIYQRGKTEMEAIIKGHEVTVSSSSRAPAL